MLATIAKEEGASGLYSGVWVMSYKTVLFNSLMMALKQKMTALFAPPTRKIVDDQKKLPAIEGAWRENLMLVNSTEKPWITAERNASVVYVDGSWSLLHAAQKHFLTEAARRGDHLIVGVHSDKC